jgi:hypothetical protein
MTKDEAFAHDYSKTMLSQGLVCFNTNNYQYCVVIKGDRGSENDRCSLVLEFCGDDGFMLHTPPNRALIPTGKVIGLKNLAKIMKQFVVVED